MFHRFLRHIRRSHQASIKQLNYYALLTCNSCHFAMNALEFAYRHNNIITQLELGVIRSDGNDVRILD